MNERSTTNGEELGTIHIKTTYATAVSLKFTVRAPPHQLAAKFSSRIQEDERWGVGRHGADERLVEQR